MAWYSALWATESTRIPANQIQVRLVRQVDHVVSMFKDVKIFPVSLNT